ncbi:MAG: AI-2E family transporter [Longimicrobiales bacterium]|nr:AI-2E family transporter [Longimicrobiales bacterium]
MPESEDKNIENGGEAAAAGDSRERSEAATGGGSRKEPGPSGERAAVPRGGTGRKRPDEDPAAAGSHRPGSKPLQQWVLLGVVIAITGLFLVMIDDFIITLILAGVFAGMARPVYLWLADTLGGSPRIASLLTVVALLLLIVVPIGAFLALVLSQAVQISDQAGPFIRDQLARWPELSAWLQGLPGIGQFVPTQAELVSRASELIARTGSFLIDRLGAATSGTVSVVLHVFVMLYAVYFFLTDGPAILGRILYYAPLEKSDEQELVEQFVSVTRATIKGSILVGLVQGALAGAAFFVLDLPGAAFWSTVMAVLSIIPVLGSGIVWAPAAVILAVSGRMGAGVALALWGVGVVGLVDNFLRPRLVGRDTKMHDLLVLLSTFGGLAMFGLVGFIIGPIVGALFLTAWKLYGTAFKGVLPAAPDWVEHLGDEVEDPA